jgi:hypothetical protein
MRRRHANNETIGVLLINKRDGFVQHRETAAQRSVLRGGDASWVHTPGVLFCPWF